MSRPSRPSLTAGVHIPIHGTQWRDLGLADMARAVEETGFDSVWLSDHVVLVEGARSPYPFSDDGAFFTPPGSDWLDWVTAATYVAASTSRVVIGVGVCVLPLREPLPLAKQLATLDCLSGGRLLFGAGSGWLAEEFDALGIDFGARGRRMDGALALLRASFTGAPAPGSYGPWSIPAGVRCMPVPIQERLPIYIGGDSAAAFRRIAEHGDGWYASGTGGDVPLGRVAHAITSIDRECDVVCRSPDDIEIAARIAVAARQLGTTELDERLAAYRTAGVTRLSFDIGWRTVDEARERLHQLMEHVRRVDGRR